MPHASASSAVSSRTRHPSSRDLRVLRVVVAVFTLVALVAAAVFVLPSAGLLLFLAGLALLFALPFAVVASVADALEPFQ